MAGGGDATDFMAQCCFTWAMILAPSAALKAGEAVPWFSLRGRS